MLYVYILASKKHGTLYIGVTNSLAKRVAEHRCGRDSQFVKSYGVHRLGYIETFERIDEAIAREKQSAGSGTGKSNSLNATTWNGSILVTWSVEIGFDVTPHFVVVPANAGTHTRGCAV